VFFLWTQPTWVAVIHNHPKGGQWIYIALALQAMGLLWLLTILKSES
jgi:Flp pilus assembly protein TadB